MGEAMSTMRALVVDDSRAMQSIIRRILTNAGFAVSQASGGEEALAALSGEAADVALICVDYNMPRMHGADLVRRIRERSLSQGIKILMITTETQISSIEAAFNAGVDEYLMKPFTPEMFGEKLQLLGLQTGVSL